MIFFVLIRQLLWKNARGANNKKVTKISISWDFSKDFFDFEIFFKIFPRFFGFLRLFWDFWDFWELYGSNMPPGTPQCTHRSYFDAVVSIWIWLTSPFSLRSSFLFIYFIISYFHLKKIQGLKFDIIEGPITSKIDSQLSVNRAHWIKRPAFMIFTTKSPYLNFALFPFSVIMSHFFWKTVFKTTVCL